MESGRVMDGLANSKRKKWKTATELFVCDLGCIVLNWKWTRDAKVARLGIQAFLLCLVGLADGFCMHAYKSLNLLN